jgi:hypothetical protein
MTEKEAQFVPFPSSDRPVTVKRPPASLRLEGDLNTSPEYKESFINVPRERPVVKKPPGHLQHDPKALLLFVDEPIKGPKGLGRPPSNLHSEAGINRNPEHRLANTDLPTERPVTGTQGHGTRRNGESTASESQTPRAQSERRYREASDVDGDFKRTYVDYTARGRTLLRRRPENNTRGARCSSLAAATISPQASRRLNTSTRVVPTATHGSGVYHTVSRDEPKSKAKTVTFEFADRRPKTCP